LIKVVQIGDLADTANVLPGVRMLANARLTEEQRRALRVLSRHSDGCAEELLRARGFSLEQLSGLVARKFATMEPTLINVSSEDRLVVWMRITAAGRTAIGE
jgi:hypothetical protein